MYGYSCRKCGCSLDPGEGNICDECSVEQDKEQLRKEELDRMIRSTDYKQMEMEEFFNECNKNQD